jgi:hypothetical protein
MNQLQRFYPDEEGSNAAVYRKLPGLRLSAPAPVGESRSKLESLLYIPALSVRFIHP